MNDLSGRTAVVTGGGTGIGEGVALALARLGMNVVICGRRREPIGQTVERIRTNGGQACAVPADVADVRDAARVVQTAVETYGTLDVLINNAGISGGGRIHAHDVTVWDRVMAVNLRGPFLMARAALPHMRLQKRGHIVNVSSEAGLEYYEGTGAYGVSKHALNALGEIMQRENQELGIRVDTICPGMVVSEMTEDAPRLDYEKCLTPHDIADLVVWLVTRRENIKIGTPVLIQTMENPWRT